MIITVHCPSCATGFPVDTNKIPVGGVHARCSACQEVFEVTRPEEVGIDELVADATPVAEASVEEAAAPVAEGPVEEAAAPEAAAPIEEAAAPAPDAFPEETALPPTPMMEEASEAATEEEEPAPPVEVVEPAPVAEAAEETSPAAEMPVEAAPELAEEPAAAAEIDAVDAAEEAVADVPPPVGDEEPAMEEAPANEAAPAEEAHVAEEAPGLEAAPAPAMEAPSETASAPPSLKPFNPFARKDPRERAARVARVLVSDMITYNADKHARALETGTLKEEFDEEIKKSYTEFVDRVGEELAQETTFFTDALNDILAVGKDIFD
jgi:predicted Zn finger-like uncharacterized protein